ncbi:MAG: type I-U CRISPR-associated protein Csx17 [Dehalococcoidia bacterium]|nr:type I-U CRISPR-associated protein Csx17 [Dehalococcoidia bacterium]
MTDIHELELRGCSPDPLMSYLKALGVFRLVSEQVGPDLRAWWNNDTFHLRSTLDRDGLTDFFLNEYRPTPIVSPWNGGSGFYPRDNSKAMETILEVESPKFQLWYEVISESKKVLGRSENQELKKAEQKEWILSQCRARFPDDALEWLDAAYVLTSDGVKFPPLLGTGGNDGRLEFSNNFMQNIVLALNLEERRNGETIMRSQVVSALFGEGSPELVRKRSTGFYNPSSVGGANSSVGFNDDSLSNPWDYILMFEGALMFAGAAARRLSAQGSSKAVFPFTVDNSAAGYGTSSESEYGDSSRAEFWAPLWNRPVSLRELERLMSEGRAQLGRRQVSSGSDFARAVTGLGTERGVSEFQRYGFLVRNGLAYLAAPLGRFYSDQGNRGAAERANVLFDLDQWLDSLRRAASGRNAPAELGAVRRRIDNAIIEFCQRGQPRDLQDVLIAVGQAERWISRSGIRESVSPLRNFSRGWLTYANNDSVEFRLARAMASILYEPARGKREVGPIRENLEPVATQPRVEWKEGSVSCVWTAGDPLSNMLSVLQRRCMEGRMNALGHPPLDSAYSARLSDIVRFLNGNVDFQRIADLALPLSLIGYRHRSRSDDSQPFRAPFDLPSAYAAMKLTLLPNTFKCSEFGEDRNIRMEPRMLAMLRAGRVKDAYEVAYRRLVASGLRPISDSPSISDRSDAGRRLAAALLFPIEERAYGALAERALRKPEDKEF